jgi:hypothetical protein
MAVSVIFIDNARNQAAMRPKSTMRPAARFESEQCAVRIHAPLSKRWEASVFNPNALDVLRILIGSKQALSMSTRVVAFFDFRI